MATSRRTPQFLVPITFDLALVFMLHTEGLLAQTPPSTLEADARVQYDAAFYTQFSPRTALDMVSHTPGFVLDSGDDADERRGFEGGVANVLIDGERPIAKKATIAEVLRGIPSARVVRVEILRASDTAGDASGNTVLANVVLRPPSWQGAWSGGVELANQHIPAPNGFLSAVGMLMGNEIRLNSSSYSLLRSLPGTRLVRDESGTATEQRTVISPRHFHEYASGLQLIRPVGPGRLEVAAKGSHARYHEETVLESTIPRRPLPVTEDIPYGQREWAAEVGLSYKRPLAAWDVTFLSLLTRKDFRNRVTSTRREGESVVFTAEQMLKKASGEWIVRTTAARTEPRRFTQLGIEGTLNTLEGNTKLTLDLGDGRVVMSIPNAAVNVRENRAEAFVSHTWRPRAEWSLDGHLALELSNLRFRGDVTKSVALAYVKPSVSISRTFANRTQLYGRLARVIGQLDFADFVSTASLADEQLTGANPDLRPQSSWRGEAGADFRFHTDAGIRIAAFRDWYDNVVDWIAYGEGDARIDAPGNAGRARAFGATISSRSKVPGVAGLSLTLAATIQRARVVDPLTARVRPISELEPVRLNAGVRQSLLGSKVALGTDYSFRSGTTIFRLKETDWQRVSPSLDAFVECPLSSALKLRIQATSILGSPERRRRTFFEPDRARDLVKIEDIRRSPGHWWVATVSGSF